MSVTRTRIAASAPPASLRASGDRWLFGYADIVTGSGEGGGSRVIAYNGSLTTADGTPPTLLDFDAFTAFDGGVYVG